MVAHPDAGPMVLAEQHDLLQDDSEDSIMEFVNQVLDANPAEVERYRSGEKKLMGFFMGQLMKISKGKAEPKMATSALREKLENQQL